jgi:polyketide synthase PksN
MAKIIDIWVGKKKYVKLLDLWVKGLVFDWNKLYGEQKPRRISLPTYPFARERYWVPEGDKQLSASTDQKTVGALHPLLHQNTSTLSEQRFTSTFTGEEFFLNDHRVMGKKILPGVAYLEMARAAIAQAVDSGGDATSVELENIVWMSPLRVNDNAQPVHVGLYPQDDDRIAYEIYTQGKTDEAEPVIHSQGAVALVQGKTTAATSLNIDDLKARIHQRNLTPTQCYDAFKMAGLEYGAAHQAIESLFIGENEVLAKVSLPDCIKETRGSYVLHPAVMDAALHASIGLNGARASRPALPFALERLEVSGPCNDTMWAWVRYSAGNSASDRVQKLDIDLCDDAGAVCVRMRGFSSRTVQEGQLSIPASKQTGRLLLQPVWDEQPASDDRAGIDYAEHHVLLCGFNAIFDDLRAKMPRTVVTAVQPRAVALAQRFQDASLQLFEAIQGILKEKPTDPVLIQVLAPNQGAEQVYTALAGLLKTARLENPNITGQVIAVEPDLSAGSAEAKLTENRFDRHAAQIRYDGGKRLVAGLMPIAEDKKAPPIPWKEGGVYLITGGLGGLGVIFAQTIAANTRNVTLILTGRSPLDAKKEQVLEKLWAQGAGVDYQAVDVTDKKAVEDLLQTIEQTHGRLTGILHSAGVNHDDFIVKKSRQDFAAVLSPKVAGTVNLDQTAQDTAMDLFVLFSSTAGVVGNVGQCDYATANGFMDAYAHYRNTLVEKGDRYGRTLSIDWPLWQDGGMGVDGASEQLLRERTGMAPMSSPEGIAALNESLTSRASQVLVLSGDINRLYPVVMGKGDKAGAGPKENVTALQESDGGVMPAPEQDVFETRVTEYLKMQLSTVLRLPAHRIEAQKPLEAYGIDSIMAMQLTNELEKIFGSLSKTLFFEYQTIQELSRYFMDAFRSQLLTLFDTHTKPRKEQAIVPQQDAPGASLSGQGYRQRFRVLSEQKEQTRQNGPLDIAIIGLSGKYPQSDNLDAYWENLRQGKDCITQVPASRWDWRKYYSQDRTKTGHHYSKWGGFIRDVDKFDPLFFGISPRQAKFMDPQERLFLEHVWIAMEDAGYCRADLQKQNDDDLPGQVGVYAGVMYGEYQLFGIPLGNSYASIANRVSYVLNLHGPSMTVDTMCSSSLTSLHLACQDLKQGRTDLGIAGGVNVSIHPNKYFGLSAGQFISSQGHCESFGRGADGYIPGEGVGVALLKRLAEARRDGDHIYGVIKASALNHGGKTNGYTVPNPHAQQSVISRALKEAQIEAQAISYIEAHGTGTKLGDPIEIAALSRAFGRHTDQKQYCAIGSVKSNIGHCESAAGIAALTKVLLQMRYGKLVPSLHSKELNPNIDFAATPFEVNQTLQDWQTPQIDGKRYGRIAGISSFGAGGSNAHMVVEEYVAPAVTISVGQAQPADAQMIVLSAKNEERLKAAAKNLYSYLADGRESANGDLASIAYTLQVGREAMEARLGLIVNSVDALQEKLAAFSDGKENIVDLYRGQVKRNNDSLAVFTADEDLQKAIEAWISKGKYRKLLDLWVKGLVVDWNKLYPTFRPKRISLPTYPFAKDRYWVPEAGLQSTVERASNRSAIYKIEQHGNNSPFSPREMFPELIGLNNAGVQKRPVFWFHSHSGGVEEYSGIGEASRRPFYGIQARGLNTDRLPLPGIQAMADYYIQVLQSVQPEGPYDLGGCSLGALLSYEVTRQLQQIGQTVNTIVMIDGMYPPNGIVLSNKTRILRAANLLLMTAMNFNPEKKLLKNLIHREELNLTEDDNDILSQVCRLARAKGLKMKEDELFKNIKRRVTVQNAYDLQRYSILPLLDSASINGYYFRNENGVFNDELEPYAFCEDTGNKIDDINHWEKWKDKISRLQLLDVSGYNHFGILREPNAVEKIKSFCQSLYCGLDTATLKQVQDIAAK